MVIDTSRDYWTGTEPSDIDEFVVELVETDGGYVPTRFAHSACATCSGDTFRVVSDPEQYVERTCVGCGDSVEMLGSADIPQDEREVGPIACPCGDDRLQLATGFAPFSDDADLARWVYVGFRCTVDGVLGVLADWKEDGSLGDLAALV